MKLFTDDYAYTSGLIKMWINQRSEWFVCPHINRSTDTLCSGEKTFTQNLHYIWICSRVCMQPSIHWSHFFYLYKTCPE